LKIRLISLESDKAAMDVPSPVSGVVNSVEIRRAPQFHRVR